MLNTDYKCFSATCHTFPCHTSLTIGRSKEGAPGLCASSQSNFFYFYAVFGENLAKKIGWLPHLWGWHSPSGKSWIRHCNDLKLRLLVLSYTRVLILQELMLSCSLTSILNIINRNSLEKWRKKFLYLTLQWIQIFAIRTYINQGIDFFGCKCEQMLLSQHYEKALCFCVCTWRKINEEIH